MPTDNDKLRLCALLHFSAKRNILLVMKLLLMPMHVMHICYSRLPNKQMKAAAIVRPLIIYFNENQFIKVDSFFLDNFMREPNKMTSLIITHSHQRRPSVILTSLSIKRSYWHQNRTTTVKAVITSTKAKAPSIMKLNIIRLPLAHPPASAIKQFDINWKSMRHSAHISELNWPLSPLKHNLDIA